MSSRCSTSASTCAMKYLRSRSESVVPEYSSSTVSTIGSVLSYPWFSSCAPARMGTRPMARMARTARTVRHAHGCLQRYRRILNGVIVDRAFRPRTETYGAARLRSTLKPRPGEAADGRRRSGSLSSAQPLGRAEAVPTHPPAADQDLPGQDGGRDHECKGVGSLVHRRPLASLTTAPAKSAGQCRRLGSFACLKPVSVARLESASPA